MREIGVVAGEAVLDRAAERDEIARRGDLVRIGQAGRVLVDRAVHAKLARLAGHHVGERVLGPADVLGHRRGDVVGGLGDERLDGVLDLDGLPGAQPQLRGRLDCAWAADAQLAVEVEAALLQLFEEKIEGHHLGDGRGMAKRILVFGVQDAAGLGVHHHGRIGRIVAASLRNLTLARFGGGGRERDDDGGRNNDRRERTEARANRTCHF